MKRDISEGTVIFDAKGLMLHSLYGSKDPDAFLIERTLKDGTTVTDTENTAEHGLRAVIERYLLPITEQTAPRRIIAVWDGGNDYRKGLYDGYKAKRHIAGDEKDAQVKARDTKLKEGFQRLMACIGITQCQVAGVEADDVIALLVQKLPGNKLVLTVDADLLQMTSDTTQVMLKGEVPEGDGYKMNDVDTLVPFHLVSLVKSMLGDASDEYPGVKGFGPSKLNELVASIGYDGLEELEVCVKNFEFDPIAVALAGAAKNKDGKYTDKGDRALGMLYENRNDWGLMYAVASLHPELCSGVRDGKPVKIQWYKRVPDKAKLHALLTSMDCEMFMTRLEGFTPTATLVTKDNYQEVLRHYKQHLAESPYVGFDYESYDALKHPDFVIANKGRDFVDVLSQSITGASLCYGSNHQHVIYLSLDHKDTNNLEESHLLWAIQEAEKVCRLVVQNASFELALTETNLEYRLETPIDTLIMASYVDENKELGLKQSSWEYLRYKQTTYKEALESAGVDNMQQLTGEQVLSYGCDDAVCTLQVFDLFKLILDIEGTWDFVNENEFDTVHPLFDGFEKGVRIDYDRLKVLELEDAKVIEDGMVFIRSTLAEHCSVPNVEAAMNLYEDLAMYEKAKLQAAEKSEGFIESKLLTMKEKIISEAQYRPFEESRKPVEFIPTIAKLNEVISQFAVALPEITSVAASKISGWLADAEDAMLALSAGGEEIFVGEAVKFMTLLTDAVPQLKKREGEAYAALAAFCSQVLSRNSAIITTGTELNFDSPVQMQIMLYAMLGMPIRLRSKVQPGSGRDKLNFEGGPATDDKAVEMAIAEDAPIGSWKRELLETYRKVNSALTRTKMYYVAYPLWKHPSDGVVHGSIKNPGTVTRRPSGASPNLLQISKKDGSEGIRSAVLPRYDDHVIISPDFAGQELRIMTSESLDAVLLEAYLGEVKKDIHSVTASGISPIILERLFIDVYKQFKFGERGMNYDDFVAGRKCDDKVVVKALEYVRKVAKAVNFLIIYGGGPSTLARSLGIPVQMAKAIMEYVFRCYPGIQPWQLRVINFAKTHGYVQDAYGNRRHAPAELFGSDGNKRSRVERQLANATIQGCAASILKVVLREAHETNLFKDTGAFLIAPVYDELTASVPACNAIEYTRRITSIMNLTPPGHRVPMMAEVNIGAYSWGAMIELGATPTDKQITAACNGKALKEAA